ncbi:MAG: radical SAM protein [Myxococcota bacterium]
MKALLKVGYGCNDHCAFCHTLDVRHIDGESDEIVRKVHRARELGHTMVVFSGGEPTIRPELPKWAKLVQRLGMDVGLVTNGRMLAYAELTDALIDAGLRYVYLSLHGGTARVHDLMVRSRAFEETYGALKNLSGRGLDLHVNCVVTKNNLKHLRGVVDAMKPYADASLKFSMVEPKGGGDKLFHRLMPRVKDVADAVVDALDYAREQGVRAGHGALPLCLTGSYRDGFDDLKTHAYRTMSEIGEPDLFPVDDLNKVHPRACEGCALRGPCPGLYRGYHEAFGDEELTPVKGVRSNSFDYVFETVVEKDAAEGHCPLRDGNHGIAPWDRGRDLFLKHGGRIARFRAESRDFSDEEIIRIKHTRGQVYYDVSRKDAPNDFASDLAKLERSALCASCEHAPTCTGLYEASFERVFEADDVYLTDRLRELTGAVLDVGCGEGPYIEAFSAGAEAGRVRYLGVDPDERALALLRKRCPWAKLQCATAETLPEDLDLDERFDAITVLRSWNHVHDPSAFLAFARVGLKPGGKLVVADNVAFGLVRTRKQHRRGASSEAVFEHHRNDGAVEALAHLERAGFVASSVVDVLPERSNQWVIEARVAG